MHVTNTRAILVNISFTMIPIAIVHVVVECIAPAPTHIHTTCTCTLGSRVFIVVYCGTNTVACMKPRHTHIHTPHCKDRIVLLCVCKTVRVRAWKRVKREEKKERKEPHIHTHRQLTLTPFIQSVSHSIAVSVLFSSVFVIDMLAHCIRWISCSLYRLDTILALTVLSVGYPLCWLSIFRDSIDVCLLACLLVVCVRVCASQCVSRIEYICTQAQAYAYNYAKPTNQPSSQSVSFNNVVAV